MGKGGQTFRHAGEVGGERADSLDEMFVRFCHAYRGYLMFAANQVVFYNEGAPGAEVACVVERDWGFVGHR